MVIIVFYAYKSINSYSSATYDKFIRELPNADQQNAMAMVRQQNKYQRILGRMILKELLISKYNIDYNSLEVKYNEYGKPYCKDICFNISHSHDYVIVAISNNNVGVDIEKIRKVDLSIMKIFCTPHEQEYILGSSNKYLSFWQIYTLKEAYLKFMGKDLSSIKDIEFCFSDNKIVCLNNETLNIFSSTEINNYIFSIIYE